MDIAGWWRSTKRRSATNWPKNAREAHPIQCLLPRRRFVPTTAALVMVQPRRQRPPRPGHNGPVSNAPIQVRRRIGSKAVLFPIQATIAYLDSKLGQKYPPEFSATGSK